MALSTDFFLLILCKTSNCYAILDAFCRIDFVEFLLSSNPFGLRIRNQDWRIKIVR